MSDPGPPQVGQPPPPAAPPPVQQQSVQVTEGRLLSWISAIKGLTFANVAVIGMLVVIAIPGYLVWRALNDQEILDRFLSNYRELSHQNVACAIREAKYRGGATQWSLSTGFAFIGRDRYVIAVVLDHRPNDDEMQSFCETLKLIADTLGIEAVKEAAQEVRP